MKFQNEDAARFWALASILNIEDVEPGTTRELVDSIVYVGKELARSAGISSGDYVVLPAGRARSIDHVVNKYIESSDEPEEPEEFEDAVEYDTLSTFEDSNAPTFLKEGKKLVDG